MKVSIEVKKIVRTEQSVLLEGLNKEQAELLYCMFNYKPLCKVMKEADIPYDDIRQSIGKLDVYEDYYNQWFKFRDIIKGGS